MAAAQAFTFDAVPARCTACGADPETRTHLLWPCLPILSYGNVREAQAVSLGLNPSDNLFYRRGTRIARESTQRLPMLEDFGAASRKALSGEDVLAIMARQQAYFAGPVARHPWFQRWDALLQAAHPEWTYERGSVAHLDLACCATDQWSRMSPHVHTTLLRTCRPHFLQTIEQARHSPWLLLNGRTIHAALSEHLRPEAQGSLMHSGQSVRWESGCFQLASRNLPYFAWNQFLTRVKPELRRDLGRLIAERLRPPTGNGRVE